MTTAPYEAGDGNIAKKLAKISLNIGHSTYEDIEQPSGWCTGSSKVKHDGPRTCVLAGSATVDLKPRASATARHTTVTRAPAETEARCLSPREPAAAVGVDTLYKKRASPQSTQRWKSCPLDARVGARKNKHDEWTSRPRQLGRLSRILLFSIPPGRGKKRRKPP